MYLYISIGGVESGGRVGWLVMEKVKSESYVHYPHTGADVVFGMRVR